MLFQLNHQMESLVRLQGDILPGKFSFPALVERITSISTCSYLTLYLLDIFSFIFLEVECQLRKSIEDIYSNCNRLSDYVFKEPVQRRASSKVFVIKFLSF